MDKITTINNELTINNLKYGDVLLTALQEDRYNKWIYVADNLPNQPLDTATLISFGGILTTPATSKVYLEPWIGKPIIAKTGGDLRNVLNNKVYNKLDPLLKYILISTTIVSESAKIEGAIQNGEILQHITNDKLYIPSLEEILLFYENINNGNIEHSRLGLAEYNKYPHLMYSTLAEEHAIRTRTLRGINNGGTELVYIAAVNGIARTSYMDRGIISNPCITLPKKALVTKIAKRKYMLTAPPK